MKINSTNSRIETLFSRKACSALMKPNSDTDSMNNVDDDAVVVNTDD